MSLMQCRTVNSGQRGISLLEVLAAMVILSAGASVAFSWFNQSAIALAQIKGQEFELLARGEALEYLQHINPDRQLSGQVQFNSFYMSWNGQVVMPTARTVSDLGTPSGYTVSLNRLQVSLKKIDSPQENWVNFSLDLAGYTKIETTGGIFGQVK
jgi:prepilin-type N-terminal cleavage/methylation domain-containing protein